MIASWLIDYLSGHSREIFASQVGGLVAFQCQNTGPRFTWSETEQAIFTSFIHSIQNAYWVGTRCHDCCVQALDVGVTRLTRSSRAVSVISGNGKCCKHIKQAWQNVSEGVGWYTFDSVASLSHRLPCSAEGDREYRAFELRTEKQKGAGSAKTLTSGNREIKDKALYSWELVLQVQQTWEGQWW